MLCLKKNSEDNTMYIPFNKTYQNKKAKIAIAYLIASFMSEC